MKCEHHPEYDPTSGEPTGEIIQATILARDREGQEGIKGGVVPCPYCWQAYAEYQAYRATRYNSLNNELEGRVKELELDNELEEFAEMCDRANELEEEAK